MLEQKYGRIVLTGSGSGLMGSFGQSNYAAAKMAMLGLMNCLKIEGERYNIKVNTISPAAATRMTTGLRDESIQKYFKPEPVSTAVAWLCSEDCEISGEIIAAAAGFYTAIRLYRTATLAFEQGTSPSLEQFAAATPALLDFSDIQPLMGFSKEIQKQLLQGNQLQDTAL